MTLGDILGVPPGSGCDPSGSCIPGVNGFTATAVPLAGICVAQPEVCAILLGGTIAVLYGPQIIHTAKEVIDFTSEFSKCLHQFIEDVKACNEAYPPGPARDECHKKARQKFDLCKGGGTIQ